MNYINILRLLVAMIVTRIVKSELIDQFGKTNELKIGVNKYDYYGHYLAQNILTQKMQCIIDVIDEIDAEFNLDGSWASTQEKLLANVNNVLLCLKYQSSFQMQR